MTALGRFNPKTTVIIDKRYEDYMKGFSPIVDSSASLSLEKYDPMVMTYKSNSKNECFGVFSEIYYSKGWNVYIDDKPTDYLRVDYLLRGLRIPAGEHKITFKFEPKTYYTAQKAELAGSAILILLLLSSLFMWYKKQ